METPSVGAIGQRGQQVPGDNDALRGLDLSDFLDLMITEMQNQDPLDPMENSEILQQISQIREIEATNQLNATLDAVLLGQQFTAASGLVGKLITGLSDTGDSIIGVVEGVSVEDGVGKLHIGTHRVDMSNVRGLLGANALVGNIVRGVTDAGDPAAGLVERAFIEDGVFKLQLGGANVDLRNLREVLDAEQLIGRWVTVVDENGDKFSNFAIGLSTENGTTKLRVGGRTFDLSDLRDYLEIGEKPSSE